MADWTDHTTLIASLAAGKAYTDEKAQAQAENPVALAEGAPGAVVLQQSWHPYDMVAYGDGGDGVIYDFAVDGAVATVTTPTLVSGYHVAFDFIGLTTGSAGGATDVPFSILIERASASGTFEQACVSTGDNNAGAKFSGRLEVFHPTVSQTAHNGIATGIWRASANAVALDPFAPPHSSATTITRLRFSMSGNFAGGKIIMERRLRAV
jgi:hypothetical protein